MKKWSISILLVLFLWMSLFAGCGGGNTPATPGAPEAPTLTPADSRLTVNWTAVTGATSYEVWYHTVDNSGAATKFIGDSNETDTTCVITGLTNGTPYYIWIKAKNSAGLSGFSLSASETPVAHLTAPAAPGMPTLIVGNGQLTVTWTSVTGAISYEVWYHTSDDSGAATKFIGDSNETDTTCVITGLANGTPYYIWVKAKNNTGLSGFSPSASGTPVAPGPTYNPAVWTQATPSAAFSARSAHTSVVFNNKMWVIGGEGSGYKNDVWNSIDGVTWTQATANAAFPARNGHTSVVFTNKMWVIGGYNGGNIKDVWSSTDGVTWTQATANAAFSTRSGHTSVVFDNKMWVIGGYTSESKNDVWNSTDGVTWTPVTTNAAFSARGYLSCVVFNNKMWIIGGYATGNMNDVWSSTDGETWTQVTADAAFSARCSHTSVVFDNKMWVIGGNSTGGCKNDVWYSSDGVTWTQATANAAFPTRQDPTSVVFDNKMWVIGGYESDYMNDVWHNQ